MARFFRSWQVVFLSLVSLLLTGCIQTDVGIHFDSPQRGEIVQEIVVSDRLRSLSDTTVKQWLGTVEQRTRRLGGRVERRSPQELALRIPFGNGADLETKFNQLFSSSEASPAPARSAANRSATPDLPEIVSHLDLHRNNLLLLERNRFRYDLDLRSLGVLSSNGNVLISPAALLELEFRLETPWGARSVAGADAPEVQQNGRQLVWTLVPGEQNHLEAVFWMPSPLGIGTVVIVLLVAGGQLLKTQFFPSRSSARSSESETPQATS